MPDPADFKQQISVLRTRLCARSPFFGCLALFATVVTIDKVRTAATNGTDILINTQFFAQLTPEQQEGLYLHEVLHTALLHVPRGVGRDVNRWNAAADIVVNGILAKEGYSLPDDSIRDAWLEQFSVEEVYDLLQQPEFSPLCSHSAKRDLLYDASPDPSTVPRNGEMSQAQRKKLETYWRNAQEQANILAETTSYGIMPASLRRELRNVKTSQLNWRQYLWRYLVQTPMDFEGFDRRFIGQRLYLDALAGETVQVVIGIDTSGSILDQQLRAFLSEVQGILRAYPNLKCTLYYIDTEAHGPYKLSGYAAIPPAIGGGGTDFRPFFDRIAKDCDASMPSVAVYLTDGYGEFPDTPPTIPLLWVVTAGGLDQFPFGEVVRLTT